MWITEKHQKENEKNSFWVDFGHFQGKRSCVRARASVHLSCKKWS
jgi:hypothetical protein